MAAGEVLEGERTVEDGYRPPPAGDDAAELQVRRRQILKWGIGGGLAVIGASTVGVLWGGMDSAVRRARAATLITIAPSLAALRAQAQRAAQPLYFPSVKAFVVAIPDHLVAAASAAYDAAVQRNADAGVVAFSQSCPHEGIQLAYCGSSSWFACPACGSQFSQFGEKHGGPSPRGMTLVPLETTDGAVVVDSTRTVPGLRIGVNFGPLAPAGPFCS